jgi:hypothetical protein
MGDKVLEFFNQTPDETLPIDLQIMVFCLIWVGTWNNLQLNELREAINKVIRAYKTSEVVQKTFADYINGATDFNNLLGRVSAESNKIMDVIEAAAMAGGQNGGLNARR